MANEGNQTPSTGEGSPTVTPELFNMLKAMSDNIAILSNWMVALEARPPAPVSVPLGTHIEPGGPSHSAPLPGLQVPIATTSPRQRDRPFASNRFNRFQESRRAYREEPRRGYYDDPRRAHEEEEESDDEEWEPMPPRGHQGRGGREPEQDGIGKIKVKIPSFEGKCDPDVYMDWETKLEQIWNCHNFPEHKKVQLATLEFNGYALIWWDNLVKERRRALDPAVATWEQMKALMRARFVPQHHARELRQRLENLKQGSMSAEETYNAMQVAMVRANVDEDEETTMARYLRILNSQLANEVDMFPYATMTELLHLAIKVEKRNKGRYQGGRMQGGMPNSWKGPNQNRGYQPYGREPFQAKDKGQSSKPHWEQGGPKRNVQPTPSAPNPRPAVAPSGPKGSTPNPPPRARDIICFKC